MYYSWKMCSATDQGQVRKRNEDCVKTVTNIANTSGAGLAILADGMGGHQGGDVASHVAVQVISEQLVPAIVADNGLGQDGSVPRTPSGIEHLWTSNSNPHEVPDDELFLDIFQLANDTIVDQARDDPSLTGMGSTLVMGFFSQNDYAIVHVGDSRCYLLEDNALSQVTEDHTLAQHYVSQGILKPDEVRTWQGRNMLMRGLGIEGEVLPDIARGQLNTTQRFLMCSDGLTDVVLDTEIEAALRENRDAPEKIVSDMITIANSRGGPDNISLALVDIV